jgi:hypothetical protein
MISDKISIIIPVVRQESAERCIESVHKYLPMAEVVTEVDFDEIGCPKMVARLTKQTTKDWVLFLGDDTEVEPGFEDALETTLSEMPDGWWGVVGVWTQPGNFQGHWMAHKRMLSILPDEQFFNEAYQHCYCENELKEIAEEHGRWIKCEGAKLLHHHPANYGEEFDDEFYKRAYGDEKYLLDKATYIKRKRKRIGKIAIGFPLVDNTVPVSFFTSFSCMEKPGEYVMLIPQFAHGPFSGNIADARNSLVEQAQMEGASHLLMLDTDQVYPPETLTKLMSHKVDICGVRVHRRWMPFDPIFMRGDVGEYESVPEEEMYSGKLIDIDATGTGCLLFDMKVFDKVRFPWFKLGIKNGKPVGEDIYFCSKARKSGIRICIDTSIEVGHLTMIEVNRWLHQICKHIQVKQGS